MYKAVLSNLFVSFFILVNKLEDLQGHKVIAVFCYG